MITSAVTPNAPCQDVRTRRRKIALGDRDARGRPADGISAMELTWVTVPPSFDALIVPFPRTSARASVVSLPLGREAFASANGEDCTRRTVYI
ncbi:hypothetical protein CHELA41_20324 [Hyphomicrobiales bacterium]|nr:hypothetical protein CHELA41_20324 [Hyphomicrobiales bacterium]